MATTTMPGGKSTVAPYVAAKGAATFLDFVEQAFDTDTALRVLNQDGTIGHAEVRIGDSVTMAFDAQPDWPDTPSFLSVYVDDVDAVVARALAAGAVIVTEVATSRIVGGRGGRIQDPAPMRELFADPEEAATMQRLQDSFAAEMRRRADASTPFRADHDS